MTYAPSVPFAEPSFIDPLQEVPGSGFTGRGFVLPAAAPVGLPAAPAGDTGAALPEAPAEPVVAQGGPAEFAERFLTSEQWVTADQKGREALAERAAVAALSKMEENKDVSIGGQKLFEEDGTYNDAGLAAMDRMKAYFTAAAKLPDGGTRLNKVTGKYEALHGMEQIFNQPAAEKATTAFDDVDDYKASLATGIHDDGKPPKATWDSYVEFVNSRLPDDSPARLDVGNKELKKTFDQGMELESFDPKSMPSESPAQIVGGKVVFNPALLNRPDLIGPWVDSLDKDWSPVERKKVLVDFGRASRGITPTGPDDGTTDFGRGWRVAWRQMPQLAYGMTALLGETANKATGGLVGEGLRDWGLEGVKDAEAGMMPLHKPNDDLDHAWNQMKKGDVGAVFDWLGYGLGYVAGQGAETIGISILGTLAGALAGGSAGAVVAAPTAEVAAPVTVPTGAILGGAGGFVAATVGKQAAKGFVRNQIRKLILNMSFKTAVKENIERVAKREIALTGEELAARALLPSMQKAAAQRIGQMAAVGSNAMMMELGSIYPEAVKQAEREGREFGGSDLARVWAWGTLSGLTEFGGDMVGLDLITGRFNKKLEKLVGVSGPGGSDVAKRLGKIALGALGGGLVEGSQEGVQTLFERLGAHQDVSSDEAWADYRNSVALGALGGVAGGGIGGGLSAGRDKGDAKSRMSALAQSIIGAPVERNVKETLVDAAEAAPEVLPEFEAGLVEPTVEDLTEEERTAAAGKVSQDADNKFLFKNAAGSTSRHDTEQEALAAAHAEALAPRHAEYQAALADLDAKAERAEDTDWDTADAVPQVDPEVAKRVGEVKMRKDHSAYLVRRPGEKQARVMPAVSNLIGADEILTPGGKSKGGTNMVPSHAEAQVESEEQKRGTQLHGDAEVALRYFNENDERVPEGEQTSIATRNIVNAIKAIPGRIVGEKILLEQPVVHAPAGGIPNGFAGRIDIMVPVMRDGKRALVNVDIKSKKSDPTQNQSNWQARAETQSAVQQALYNKAWNQNSDIPVVENVLLYVKDDGMLWKKQSGEEFHGITPTEATLKHVQRIITGKGRPKKAAASPKEASPPVSAADDQEAPPSAPEATGEPNDGGPEETPPAEETPEEPKAVFAKGQQVKHSSGKTGTIRRVAKNGKITMETAEGESIKDESDKFEAHDGSTKTPAPAEQSSQPSQPEASTESTSLSTETAPEPVSQAKEESPAATPAAAEPESTTPTNDGKEDQSQADAKGQGQGLLNTEGSPDTQTPAAQVEQGMEDSLDDGEKAIVAKELGFAKWSAQTAKTAAIHFADWLAGSVKTISKALAAIYEKLKAHLGKLMVAGIGVVSLHSDAVSDFTRVSFSFNDVVSQVAALPAVTTLDSTKIGTPKETANETSPQQVASELAGDMNEPVAIDTGIPASLENPGAAPEPPPNSIDLKGHKVTDATQVMATWIMSQGDNKGRSFIVADKTSGELVFFDKTGSVLFKVPALFGRNTGDFVVMKGESFRTPAGRFEIQLYDSQDYGQAVRFMHLDTDNGSFNFMIHVVPHKSSTAPRQQRLDAIASNDPDDNRQTSGCVNVLAKDISSITSFSEEGGTLYVLPETTEGRNANDGFKELPNAEAAIAAAGLRNRRQKRSKKQRQEEATAILDDGKPGSLSRAIAWANDEKNVPDSDERVELVQALREDAADDEITTETRPVKPVPDTVFRPVVDGSLFADESDMTSGEKDSVGGIWSITGAKASYVSAKGKQLAIGTTSIVQVKTAEGTTDTGQVLVLNEAMKQADGSTAYTFDVVNLSDFADTATGAITTLLGKSNRWHSNTLLRVAKQIQPLIRKTAMSGQRFDKAEMKSIFGQVLAQVAPDMSLANFVEAELPGSDFIQVAFSDVVDGKVTPYLQVDWQKMANTMAVIFGNSGAAMTRSDAGNAKSNNFYEVQMGVEVARVISRFVSEETLHLSAAEFTEAELMDFHRDAESVAATSPVFLEIYGQTVDERFEANGWVERSADGSVKSVEWAAMTTEPRAVAAVVHEVLRKLHQMAYEGETTEQTMQEARQMALSILADTEAEKSGTGLMKAGRVIARLLKRYAERLKRVLTVTTLNGRMTPNMRAMMLRLKENQRERGIRSDTDMARAGVAEWLADIRDVHKDASNERIRETTKQVTAGLQAMRLINSEFKDLGIEDLLEVDLQAMRVGLAPEVMSALAKLRTPDGELKYNLPAVEAAIDELNRINVAVEVREQIWHSQWALDAAREALPMNLAELFSNTNPLRWNDHQMKVNAMILDGIRQHPSRGHLLLAHIQSLLAHAYTDRDRARAIGDSAVLSTLRQINWNRPEGQTMIGRIALAIGLEDYKIGSFTDQVVPEQTYLHRATNDQFSRFPTRHTIPGFTISALEQWRNMVIDRAVEMTESQSGSLLEAQRENEFFPETERLNELDRSIEDLEAQRKLFMDLQEDQGDAAHHHKVLERYARLEAANPNGAFTVDENGQPFSDLVDEKGFRTTVAEQLKTIEEDRAKARLALLAIDTEARRVENEREINEVYQAYETYVDALYNANASVRHAARVAMGDGYLNTKGFGQEFANLSDERLRDFLAQKDDQALADFESWAPSARRSKLAQLYIRSIYGRKAENQFEKDSQGQLPEIDPTDLKAMPFGFRHNSIGLIDPNNAANNRAAHTEPFAKGALHNAIGNVQDSNAAYVGMRAFHQFAHMLADGVLLVERESKAYSALGGFAADARYNPESRQWEFPSYFEVLPVLESRSELNDLRERLKGWFGKEDGKKVDERIQRLKFMNRFGDPAVHRQSLETLGKWIKTVQRSLSSERTELDPEDTSMDTVSVSQPLLRKLHGKQTIAGRVEGVLRRQLEELSVALDNHDRAFTKLEKDFKTSETIRRENAIRDEYRSKRNDPDMTDMDAYEAFRKARYMELHNGSDEGYTRYVAPAGRDRIEENEIKTIFDSSQGTLNKLVDGMWYADLTVKLARHAMRRFSDPDIRRETYRDLNRVIQDAGYESSNPEFMSVRDSNIDPATLSTLTFAMDYYGTTENPSFGIGPSLALDLLAARNGNWNNDENELISPTVVSRKASYELRKGEKPVLRWQPFDEQGNPVKDVQAINSEWIDAQVEPGTDKVSLTNYAQTFAGKPGQWVNVLDANGDPVMLPTVYQVRMDPAIPWSGQVVNGGKYVYARKDIDQGAPFPREAGSDSNAKEDVKAKKAKKNLKNMDAPRQMRNRQITREALIIGYVGKDAHAAQRFLYDIDALDRNFKKASDKGVSVMDLIRRGLRGLWNIESDPERVDALVEEFLNDNPAYFENFRSIDPVEDSVTAKAIQVDTKRFDAETFLTDLLQFKAAKEEAEIIRLQNLHEPVMLQLEGALGGADSIGKKRAKELRNLFQNQRTGTRSMPVYAAGSLSGSVHRSEQDNAAAWLLLRALPGAIVWAPSQRDLLGTEIKARLTFIPARDGMEATPPVIFAPQGSRMGLDDSRYMISKALLEHAKDSPWLVRQLARFADRGREMLSYAEIINRAEASLRGEMVEKLARRSVFKAMRKRIGDAVYKHQLEGVKNPTPTDRANAVITVTNAKGVFDVALRRWFDQMSQVAEALDEARKGSSQLLEKLAKEQTPVRKSKMTAAEEDGRLSPKDSSTVSGNWNLTDPFAMIPGLDVNNRDDMDLTVLDDNSKRDVTADVAFVAEVLANPKMRQLYEMFTLGEAQDLGWAPPKDRSEIIDAIIQGEKPVVELGRFGPEAWETIDMTELPDDMPATSPWESDVNKVLTLMREGLLSGTEKEMEAALETAGMLERLDDVSHSRGVVDSTRNLNMMLPDRGVGEGYRSGSMTRAQANIYNLLAGVLRQAQDNPVVYGMRTATRMVERPYEKRLAPETPWGEPTVVTRTRMEEESYEVVPEPIAPSYKSSFTHGEDVPVRDQDLRFFSRVDALRIWNWEAASLRSEDLAPVLGAYGNNQRVTDWASLAKVGGSGHMVLPPAFYKRRLNVFKTGMVGQIHGIDTGLILETLRGQLALQPNEDMQSLFNEVLRMRVTKGGPRRFNTDIAFNEDFMKKLASILPAGLLDQHLEDSRGVISGLRSRRNELAEATLRLNADYAKLADDWMALRNSTEEIDDSQKRAVMDEMAERFAASLADAAPKWRGRKNRANSMVRTVVGMLGKGEALKQLEGFRQVVRDLAALERNYPLDQSNFKPEVAKLARRFFEMRNAEMVRAINAVVGRAMPDPFAPVPPARKPVRMGKDVLQGIPVDPEPIKVIGQALPSDTILIHTPRNLEKMDASEVLNHMERMLDTEEVANMITGRLTAMAMRESASNAATGIAHFFGVLTREPSSKGFQSQTGITGGPLAHVLVDSLIKQSQKLTPEELVFRVREMFGLTAEDLAGYTATGMEKTTIAGLLKAFLPSSTVVLNVAEQGVREKMNHIDLLLRQQAAETQRLSRELARIDRRGDEVDGEMRFDVPVVFRRNPDSRGVTLRMGLQLVPEEETLAGRETFAERRMAFERAMQDYFDHGADDTFTAMKGGNEMFLDYDVERLMAKVVANLSVQNAVANRRWKEFEGNGGDVLAIERLAEVIEEDGVNDLLVVDKVEANKVRRVTRIKRGGGYEARVERIGRFLKDRDGADVMLMPVSAKEDLRAHFKATGDKRPVDTALAGLVLNAITAPTVLKPSSYAVYDLGYSAADLNKEFTGAAGHSLLQQWMAKNPGEKMTRLRAAEIYSKRLTELVTKAVNSKLLDPATNSAFTGEALGDGKVTKHRIAYWEGLMSQMVYAHNNLKRGVSGFKAFEQLDALLRQLDAGQFGSDALPMADIRNLKLAPVYAKVFAEIEGQRTMERLVTGLTGDLTETELKLLANFHHQDARIKRRFQRDWSSYMEALRMQGYLENGFFGNTGRNGYHAAYESGKKTMVEAARKLGTESMDHSLGYVIGSLGGITHARGGHVGENLMKWMKAFREGSADLGRYVKDQEEAFASKTKLGSATSRFFKAAHVDMTKDLPMVKAIGEVLERSLGKWLADHAGTSPVSSVDAAASRQAMDAEANAAIAAAVKGLHALAHNQSGVDTYANTLLTMFRDLADAVAFDKAVLGQDDSSDPAEGRYNLGMDPHASMYTVMPLRFVFAGSQKKNKKRMPHMDPGHRVDDPMHNVSLKGASILSKGESDPDTRRADVFHLVELNGLSAPEAILRDTVYRLNVGPNYQILRALTGKRKEEKGKIIRIINPLDSELMKIRDTEQGKLPEERDPMNNELRWKMTLAAVAGEIEGNINNDASMGMHNTQFSKALQFMSTMFVFRALFSIQQLPLQTIPSVIGYLAKKLMVRKTDEALVFLQNLTPLVGGAILGKKWKGLAGSADFIGFSGDANEFIKSTSPWVHARGSEGMDENRNLKRRQVPFGAGAFKKKVIRGGNELIAAQEAGLDFVIARWERPIARSIYLTELVAEMNRMKADPSNGLEDAPANARDLIARHKAGTLKIPQSAIIYATIKVSDHMGLADQAKKANPFQSHTQSPTWHHLFRTMVRFSNHTATTSSNLSAQLPAAFLDSKDPTTARIRSEAIENITGTLVQNTLFQFARISVTLPLVYMLVGLLQGKDWDDAARDAQDLANSQLKTDEDASEVERLVKQVLFGTARGPFSEYKDDRAARYSGAAEISSKMLLELAQAIPYAGVFAGYSALSNLAKPTVNKISEEAMSYISGGFGFGDDRITRGPDGISIPTYKDTGIGELSGLTAPTSMLYDTLVAGNRLYNAGTMTDATAYDLMKYVVAQLIGTRELRTAMDKDFTEKIRENQ